MNERNRIYLLIGIMTLISVLITVFTIASLYRTALQEERSRLVETVESQARLFEAMARFDAVHSQTFSPGGPRGATLAKIVAAHNNYEQSGMSMEFTLAERTGEWISYLLRHRHGGLEDYLTPISIDSELAEPMRLALSGQSGTSIAEDYHGQKVIAAFEPVAELNLGVVAKVDLSEIRAPFIRAGLVSGLFAVFLVGVGATLFVRITHPMVDTIQAQNRKLTDTNRILHQEIHERMAAEEALLELHSELEIKVKNRTEELSASNAQLKKEIRDRQEAEGELKKNETMLKKIFDGILDPLILLDRHMTVLMMNRAAAAYYGAETPADVIGCRCHEALMENSDVCEGCTIAMPIDSGEYLSCERKGILDPDRVEQVVAYPILEDDGRVASVIARITDITDKKLFEQQLIQKEKLASLGVMVSSMAHEINNPNSFISFNIPILQDYIRGMLPIIEAYARDKPDFELSNLPFAEFKQDIDRLLVNIENGSRRISSFISNLREYSHQKSDVSRIWVDLGYAIESVISICHSKITKSVKSFVKEIPESLPSVLAQPYAIEQILINFLINASHAADKEDSWIKLAVAVDGGEDRHVRISISDNGQGMDDKTLTKIFDPFFTTKAPDGGTGLGLFVSHTLAQRMHGQIHVASEVGKGSTFALILPVEDRQPPDAATHAAEA